MTIKVSRLQVGGYTAQDDRNALGALFAKTAAVTVKAGIVPSDGTDFAVTAQGSPNMTLNVAKGDLVVLDAAGAPYIFHMDATKVVTVTTAPSSGTRYDTIIARVYDNAAGDAQATSNITLPGSAGTQAVQTITGDVEVIAGTAGGSPSPPALPNSGARCVVLKVVAVGTNVTSISSGNLQDSQSTTTRVGFTSTAGGVLLCTSATRPATPHLGMPIYETDTGKAQFCTNTTGPVWTVFAEDTGWTVPSMGASWANYTAGGQTAPQYRRRNGVVYLDGSMASGSSGSTIFTLPAGYRPLHTQTYTVASGNGNAVITIGATGTVQVTVYNVGSNISVALNGISFVAEQ